MTAKKRAPKAAAGKSPQDATVEAYLIEHGGATSQTVVFKDGSTATSPQFPTTLPTLAQAMKDFPCMGHGERKPAVCDVAKKVVKAKR